MTNPLYRNDRPGQHAPSWYADSADIPAQRVALKGAQTADVCIIGAGYTGLTAALRLAQKGFKVIVLEAHRAGFGASGRNGGQVGSGFNQSQQWLTRKLGETPARALWEMAETAKADLRALAPPEARYTPGVVHGNYTDAETRDYAQEAEFLAKKYGYSQSEPLDRAAMQGIVKTKSYVGGLLDMGAGHIHPLRFALSLATQAEAAGAVIHEGSAVHNITEGTPAKVQTGQGHVMAAHVILAGNGYLPNIAPKVNAKVMPINSFICATEPLGDKAAGVLTRDIAVADSKFVVNYFRLSEDKRLLFGGRESYGIGFPRDIKTKLVARMCALFPQLHGSAITHVWGGTLGITMTRLPALQRITPTIYSAAGFSGHGVALSGFAGTLMAEAIAGQAERFDIMAQLPTPSFPGGTAARAPLLTLAMTWYAMRDRLGI